MKIALCLSDDLRVARQAALAMREAQRHESDCASRLLSFDFGCLALLGRPGEDESGWPVWVEDDGSFLVLAGLSIESGGTMPGTVRGGGPVVRAALAGDDGQPTLERLRGLDGAFVALWWCAPRRELTVVTDFLGMQPLYRASLRTASGAATLLASEVKSFARAGLLPVEPDAGAWGAMLFFGHQIGPRTLLDGVTRVPAARATCFTAPAQERNWSTWEWPASRGTPDGTALRDAVGDAVRADVAAYAAAYPEASLLLSGGFDSRLILCLCMEMGLEPRVLIQSHPDENADADARFARAFARAAGLEARVFPARADIYGTDDYLRFLELNEVATPSLYLFIPNVAPLVRGERHGVWEGLLLDPALKFDYGEGGFARYLESRARARSAYREAARLVFAPEWAERMRGEFDSVVTAERACFPDDAEGVWRFSVLNRSRFRTGVNPYQVYDTTTPPLTPGMSKRFWEVVADADPAARFGKRLYRAVFDRLAPDGMRVPVATGSTLLPGQGSTVLYRAQRTRAAVQRLAQRPRVNRMLHSAGLPVPFTWQPSRFLGQALREAPLDDPRLNADWLRARRTGAGTGPLDAVALEVLMYWQAWQRVMRGDLREAWSPGGER